MGIFHKLNKRLKKASKKGRKSLGKPRISKPRITTPGYSKRFNKPGGARLRLK